MVDQNKLHRDAIEALYFAYRAFTAEPDRILAELELGRAHHRILYFVGREPGVTVGDLLLTLGISKQALAGPLKRLLQENWIQQATDDGDKRIRRLTLTQKGQKLERQLSAAQSAMLRAAFEAVGPDRAQAWLDTTHALATLDHP